MKHQDGITFEREQDYYFCSGMDAATVGNELQLPERGGRVFVPFFQGEEYFAALNARGYRVYVSLPGGGYARRDATGEPVSVVGMGVVVSDDLFDPEPRPKLQLSFDDTAAGTLQINAATCQATPRPRGWAMTSETPEGAALVMSYEVKSL